MEAATNKEITVLTTKIPMEKKFIVDNFDNFKSEDIVFNVSLKDCDYKNPKSIFTYLANCEVSNPYLNFDELETQGLDFMFNYMIEYLSFDRIYSIPQFDRFILKMLVYHVSNHIDDEALGNHLAIERTAYYMGKDIEQVILCDAILMCPGWENSKGCKCEKYVAETYGKEVLYMK